MNDTSNDQANIAEPEVSAADQRSQRIRKLEELRQQGINAYGGRVDNRRSVAAARAQFDAAEAADAQAVCHGIVIAGRLMAKRIMGKSIFADLMDESGRIQVYAQAKSLGDDAFLCFKALDIGDIISVDGDVFRTRMGEVTLRANLFTMQAKALRPLPEKWHGLTDLEQRYRQRYLDMISNAEVRETLRQRSRIVREIRNFLDIKDFMEVETPMLQPHAGGAAARPFETFYAALNTPMFMRIAPELYLKRLLVGGFERVYELNRNFRNEGMSKRHNPEFSMVEIYQAFGDCSTMMELIEEMITSVAQCVLGTLQIDHGDGKIIDLSRPWRRVSYAELIRAEMGDSWYECSHAEQLRLAQERGLDVSADCSSTEITHEVYEKIIEAKLIQPTFVTRLPASLVPLAKHAEDDGSVVDVFELEVNGQELAPGYSELNDPLEQRRRFEHQAQTARDPQEIAQGRIDEDFLTALEHGMPPAGGMGIGIDRLAMLLLGQSSIRDVIIFPQMRPRS